MALFSYKSDIYVSFLRCIIDISSERSAASAKLCLETERSSKIINSPKDSVTVLKCIYQISNISLENVTSKLYMASIFLFN